MTMANILYQTYTLIPILLPLIIQSVIMVVNGNLGTGVAVAGAFSLVRFRSIPGTSKEIASIFISMGMGLANAKPGVENMQL